MLDGFRCRKRTLAELELRELAGPTSGKNKSVEKTQCFQYTVVCLQKGRGMEIKYYAYAGDLFSLHSPLAVCAMHPPQNYSKDRHLLQKHRQFRRHQCVSVGSVNYKLKKHKIFPHFISNQRQIIWVVSVGSSQRQLHNAFEVEHLNSKQLNEAAK